jgi:hypothetical protein
MFLVIETPETTADPDTPLERYMLASPLCESTVGRVWFQRFVGLFKVVMME